MRSTTESPCSNGFLKTNQIFVNEKIMDQTFSKSPSIEKTELKIVWKNVFVFAYLHLAAIYGFYLFLFKAMWLSDLYTCFLISISGLGVTAGAHRLWSHKSYKARLPLQILLLFFNTIAVQDSVIDWVRDHRMHHKYSETNADPYNARRGFFFSHIGWLMVKKHPDIKAKGGTIEMSDVTRDPLLNFQKRYYLILAPLTSFIIAPYIATLWGESLWNTFFVCTMFRYVYLLNGTWLVNSAAHMWGTKPYDRNIDPVENKYVSWIAFGEGFHNYHHTFPWDYKTAELGSYSLNYTKIFIDFMAVIGWAYDLKTVPEEIVEKRINRTGDGSHNLSHDVEYVKLEPKQTLKEIERQIA